MFGERPENVFYYLTVYNEPKLQPAMPDRSVGRGRYPPGHLPVPPGGSGRNRPASPLLSSGTAIHWALSAQELLPRTGACTPMSGR